MWDVQSFRLSEQKGCLTSAVRWVWSWAGYPDVPRCLQHSFFPWLFSWLLPFPYTKKSEFCTCRRSLLRKNPKPSRPESRGSLRFSWVFFKWINSVNKAYTHGKMSYLLKAKVCEIEVSGAPRSNHTRSQLHIHWSTVNFWKRPQISSKPTIWSFCNSVQQYPPSSQAKTTS